MTHVEAERGGKVIDLLEALQASVKKAGGRSTASAKKGGATKRAPAKSTPARKKASKATAKTTRKAPAKKRATPATRRKASWSRINLRRHAMLAHGRAKEEIEAAGGDPNVDDSEGKASEDRWLGGGSHGWFDRLLRRRPKG